MREKEWEKWRESGRDSGLERETGNERERAQPRERER